VEDGADGPKDRLLNVQGSKRVIGDENFQETHPVRKPIANPERDA
jgi:hypothetical protein